jgi:hypothetical protein
MGHNNDRTGQLFERQTIKSSLRQLQVATSTFFIQPEKEDTDMATRRIDTQICKAFIRSDEPPLLLLYPRPECFICQTLLTLHDNSHSIVTPRREQLCHLSRQVFIHFNADTHAHPRTTRGIKSVLFTASAANFNAA